ncbi:hypothetical protein OLMES_1065 [Oleiphilus messinensis]|uniref:Uncharacterized protein n=1 Tax=Oleiphilus messinensis TaxID=141451 RepID=A0A1Y0I406_9GAMM|nr:hypothetical protein [Oleiphilus messinensis]ARU55151.1 hypothetical protein OLMES_1065 [Oleiphilus messinensis]
MEIYNCRCGSPPSFESEPSGFNRWDVFCFECRLQTTGHLTRLNAIRAWNHLVEPDERSKGPALQEAKPRRAQANEKPIPVRNPLSKLFHSECWLDHERKAV